MMRCSAAESSRARFWVYCCPFGESNITWDEGVLTLSRALMSVSILMIIPGPPPHGESSMCLNEPPANFLMSTISSSSRDRSTARLTTGKERNESKDSGNIERIVIFMERILPHKGCIRKSHSHDITVH